MSCSSLCGKFTLIIQINKSLDKESGVAGKSYLPADKFCNFALHLATMYKGENQSVIQGTFNKMFDLIQGIQEADLFNENPDTTPRTLVEAIKEVLNIDYNGQLRSNVLGDNHPASQRGQQGSTGNVASGEQNQDGQGTDDGGRGTEGDGGRSRSEAEDRTSQSEEDATEIKSSSMSADEAIDFVADMELSADIAPEIDLTIENWDALFGENGTINTPIGEVKMGENQFAKLMRQGRDGKLGMIKPTLEKPHAIVEETSEAKDGDTTERASSYIFIRSFKKADGSRYYYFTSITVSKDGREVVVSSQEKSRNKILRLLQEGSVIWRTPKDATTSSAERQGLDYEQPIETETATKGSGITPQSTSSDSKVTDNSSAEQKNAGENVSEPTHETETLENGDVRITNRNSRGEVTNVSVERDGKIVSVDSYQDGALFERTEYDDDGNATKVTRYGKNGEVVGVQEYEGGVAKTGKRSDNAATEETKGEAQEQGTAELQQGELDLDVDNPAFERATERTIDALKAAGVEVVEATDEMVEEVLGLAEMHKQKKAPETVSVQDEHLQTVVSSADGAKVLKDLDSAITEYENDVHTKEKTFLGRLAEILGATKHGSNSQYATFEAVNGKVFTIRLANHNAKVSNFDNHGENEGISIVITAQNNNGINNDGNAHVVEFFYDAIKLRKADGKPLVEILKSIKQALYSGEYKDTTGLAQAEEVNIPEFMQVYHGSGAKFDKFDHSFMGTGEGAQAFGWGTYVTEVEGIGRSYATNTSDNIFKTGFGDFYLKKIREGMADGKSFEDIKQNLLDYHAHVYEQTGGDKDMFGGFISDYETLRSLKEEDLPKRNLYTVEIPDDTGKNYLYWYNGITDEQKKMIADAAQKEGIEFDFYGDKMNANEYFAEMGKGIEGHQLYGMLKRVLGSDKAASEFLNRIGYVGIKYPTESLSGGNKDGKSNYVIFNEADAQITDRVEFLRTADGVVYGWAVDGKIYLTKEGMNPNTPAHEYTHLWAHMIEKTDPVTWSRIVDGLRGCATWNEVLNDKAYESIWNDDSRMASEVLSRLTGSENYRREMARAQQEIADAKVALEKAEKISAWEKVKMALRDFLGKVKSLIQKGERRKEKGETIRDVETDVPAWMEFVDMALGDLYGGVNPGKSGGTAELMFIGEKGAAAMDKAEEASVRLDNLAVARDMEAQGKDALAIKMATGWERGADGKWRYEIADYDSMFDTDVTIPTAEYQRYQDLRRKRNRAFFYGGESLTEAEQADYSRLMSVYEKAKVSSESKLSTILHHDELFSAYPKLKDISVRFVQMEKGKYGAYNPTTKSIQVNENLSKEQAAVTIFHEVQHAIQEIEGFAQGGNWTMTDPEKVENLRKELAELETLKSEAKQIRNKHTERLRALNNERSEWEDAHPNATAEEKRVYEESYFNRFDAIQNDIKKETDFIRDLNDWSRDARGRDLRLGHERYTLVAGEVEARNVSERMGKSMEERRASLRMETQDVADEDQIFIYEGLKSASSEENIDAVNARFNAELDVYINGGAKANMMFHVGNPMGVMQIFLPNLPIVMRPRVINKATNTKHDVSVEALHDLPKRISAPIFVFQRDDNALGVLTEIKDNNGKNVCVAIELNKIIQDGGSYLEVNDIRSIHGRDIENLILPIIHNNTLKYVDKEKGLDWLSSASSNYQQEITKQDLVSATKVVESFENPQILGQENDGDTLFSYKPFGGNSGYVGYSMSKRAAQAREEGRFPKTDFKKEYGVTEKVLDALVKAGIVDNAEWHHTSMYGNKTPFYGWEGDSYANYYADNKSEIDKIVRDLAKTEPKFKDYEMTQDGADAFAEQHRIWLKRKEEVIQDLQERFEKAEEAWQEAERARREAVLKETRLRTEYNTYIRNLNVPEEYKASNGVRIVTHGDGNPYRWDYYWGENKAFKKYSDVAREELKQFLEANRGDVPNFEEWKEGVATASQLTGTDGAATMSQRIGQGDVVTREGEGSFSDDALSGMSDPMAKMLGASTYSARQRREFAERARKRMVRRAESIAKELHLDNVEVVTDVSVLPEGKKRGAKGFYSKSTGKITIVVPNHAGTYDIQQTVLHEAVAHYGLRQLFGTHFDTFLDNVFENVSSEIRNRIIGLARQNGWDFRTATEEYLAMLAEDVEFSTAQKSSWWSKIKGFFLKMLADAGVKLDFTLSDNELRYILWRSYQNLANPGKYASVVEQAADIAKQHDLKVGNYRNSATDLDAVAEQVREREDVLFREDTPRERAIIRDRYERRVKTGWYQTQEALQDSMLGLKEAMQAIVGDKTYIEDIEGFENAYLGENRLSSVNKAEIDWFVNTHFKPLYEIVKGFASTEEEQEVLEDYMFAKHGLERNRVMAEREAQKAYDAYKAEHPRGSKTLSEFVDEYRKQDYAGLTALTGKKNVADAEAEAQRMVKSYEAAHTNTDLLWMKWNQVTKAILEKTYKSGIISKQTFDKISGMYEYYVPLRGFDETTSMDEYAYLGKKDNGFNPPVKVAGGRRSKADNPFAYLESMAESAIMQGNRNELVKQKMLNFVLNHPSDLFSVSELWLEHDDVTDEWKPVFPTTLSEHDSPEEIQQKMDNFEARMEALAKATPDKYKRGRDAKDIPYRVVDKATLSEHQVIVKRNGRSVIITVNGNPRAAQALNGMTNPDNHAKGAIDKILRTGEKVNRWLSANYTTRNPDFVAGNFFRDALYTNIMVWVKESHNYATKFHKNWALCFGKIWGLYKKYQAGTLDMSDELEVMFKQFMLNGGETGYMNMSDVEAHKKEIAKKLRTKNAFKNGWEVLIDFFDYINRSVENTTRFAAFVTSRQMGRSIDRSIYDAKEISVNFNKKGAGDKFLGETGQTWLGNASAGVSAVGRSGFVFWNAALQGSTNFGRQVKRHPVKALTASAAMFMLGALVAHWWGDDDDDDYYNLPEYVRRSNIIFQVGKSSYVSLPLPIEFRAMYGMGELMMSVMKGKERKSGLELGMEIASQASQVFPIDVLEGGGSWTAFVPSAVKPIVDVARNVDWTGLPIYKDNPYNENNPEYTEVYSSANKQLVGIFEWLNNNTGGDAHTKGAINFNPAGVEYLLESYFGGYASTADKMIKMGETWFGNREYDPRSFLLWNRLVKSGDERTEQRYVNDTYFKLKKEADVVEHRLRGYKNDTKYGIFDYAEKISYLEQSPEYGRYEILKPYQRKIEKYQRKIKEAEKKNRTDRVDEWKEKIDSLKHLIVEEVEAYDKMRKQ